MKEVIVYSKPMCSFCDNAKVFLTNSDIAFTVVDVMESKENYNEFMKYNKRTVPQIIVDGINIGGYDDLISKASTLFNLNSGD